jgi:hypothetical protein
MSSWKSKVGHRAWQKMLIFSKTKTVIAKSSSPNLFTILRGGFVLFCIDNEFLNYEKS